MRSRSARRVVSACLLAIAAAAAAGPAVPAYAALPVEACASVEQAAAAFPGAASVVLIDLESGQRCDVGAGESMRSASLYKLFMLIEAFEQRERGTLSFAEPLTIEPRHTIDDPPEFRSAFARTISVGDAVEIMITLSDNGSAVALLERLGIERMNASPARFGFGDTILGSEYVTTAADVAALLQGLYAGEIVSPEASARMLAILRAQQVRTLLPLGLPDGTTIAHKTGNLDFLAHDAGIITAPGGSYVLVAMTEADPAAGTEASFAFIPALSALVFAGYAEARPASVLDARGESEGSGGGTAAVASAPFEVPAPAAQAGAAAEAPPAEVEAPQAIPTVQPSGWLRIDQTAGAGAAGVAGMTMALASLGLWARRRASQRETAVAPSRREVGSSRMSSTAVPDYPATQPLDPSRKDPVMRIRRTGSEDSTTESTEATGMSETTEPQLESALRPATSEVRPAVAGASPLPGVIDSPRLRRLAQYFGAQGELVDGVRSDVEQESAPLIDLLIRQQETMKQVMTNLDERLRPLETYAESEETNLAQLRERLADEGTEFLSRSFADYITTQRERIDETRSRIGEQRTPFRQFGEDQQATVETALSRFDQDVAMLEEIQAEQRRVMTRLLEAMRSDTFVAVKEYLIERHEALADVAKGHVTDPGAIAETLRGKAAAVPQGPANAPGAEHLAEVLRVTAQADATFASEPGAAAKSDASTAKPPQAAKAANGRATNGASTTPSADPRLVEAVADATEVAEDAAEPAESAPATVKK